MSAHLHPGLRFTHAIHGAIGFLAILLCALCSSARAQFVPYDTVSARSVSGQFVVYAERQSPPFARTPAFTGGENFLKLEASFLAVSCERIKHALSDELGASGQWRGTIYISVHPAESGDDEI